MKQHTTGFTLVEMMIVVVLLAIMISLAIPSYQNYVVRTNRTEAIEALLAASSCQERLFIRNNAYSTGACGGTSFNNHYLISVTTSNANQNFLASAVPQGPQLSDRCKTLTINDRGVRTANSQTAAFAQTCWTGKF